MTYYFIYPILVEDMCTLRNRCDETHYTNMTPGCMAQYGELYSFLFAGLRCSFHEQTGGACHT